MCFNLFDNLIANDFIDFDSYYQQLQAAGHAASVSPQLQALQQAGLQPSPSPHALLSGQDFFKKADEKAQ